MFIEHNLEKKYLFLMKRKNHVSRALIKLIECRARVRATEALYQSPCPPALVAPDEETLVNRHGCDEGQEHHQAHGTASPLDND